jgi:hypothetical protein
LFFCVRAYSNSISLIFVLILSSPDDILQRFVHGAGFWKGTNSKGETEATHCTAISVELVKGDTSSSRISRSSLCRTAVNPTRDRDKPGVCSEGCAHQAKEYDQRLRFDIVSTGIRNNDSKIRRTRGI